MNRLVASCMVALLGLTLLMSTGCAAQEQSVTPPAQQGDSGQAGDASSGAGQSDGATLAQEKCTQCHTYDRVASAKKDEAGWESTVDRMVGYGLQVTDAERQAIVDYLVSK